MLYGFSDRSSQELKYSKLDTNLSICIPVWQLISSVDPQFLKLTKVDDQIYSEFREIFDKLKIDVLDPEELKSELAKEVRILSLKYDLAFDQQFFMEVCFYRFNKELGLFCYNQQSYDMNVFLACDFFMLTEFTFSAV